MVGDDLTVCLFLIGLAANFIGVGVSQAGWKHKFLIRSLFGFGCVFFVLGVGWVWLKKLPPIKVQAVISDVASSPISWFVMMMALLMLAMLPRKALNQVRVGAERLPVERTRLPEQQKAPAPFPASTVIREFTDKTAAQLLALFDRVTPLQATPLIEPYVGMWLRTDGAVLMTFDGGMDVGASLRKEGRPISCRFSKEWDIKLRRYDVGNTMKVIGKIMPHQNGQQLYLGECELE